MAGEMVGIAAELTAEQAERLAQFSKRSMFDTFYQYTQAHLMVGGIGEVQRALAEAGYVPSVKPPIMPTVRTVRLTDALWKTPNSRREQKRCMKGPR